MNDHFDVIVKVMNSGLMNGTETFEFRADGYDYCFSNEGSETVVSISLNGIRLFDISFEDVNALRL